MKTNWIGGLLFSTVLIGTAPARVGVHIGGAPSPLRVAWRGGDAGSRICLGGQVLGSERGRVSPGGRARGSPAG
jgi:hypothetical protein